MSTYSTQKGDAVTDSNIIRWQDVAIDDLPRDLHFHLCANDAP